MRTLVLLLVASGCSYNPDSYSYYSRKFPGQRVTVGCLDISVDRRADMDGSAVLDYQFGNRCDKSVLIDLVRVPVVGRTLDGDEVSLEPFDPQTELMALKLAARQAGGEAIAYPTKVAVAQVCVNAAAIGETQEARWLCFATKQPVAPLQPASETVDPNAPIENPYYEPSSARVEVTP